MPATCTCCHPRWYSSDLCQQALSDLYNECNIKFDNFYNVCKYDSDPNLIDMEKLKYLFEIYLTEYHRTTLKSLLFHAGDGEKYRENMTSQEIIKLLCTHFNLRHPRRPLGFLPSIPDEIPDFASDLRIDVAVPSLSEIDTTPTNSFRMRRSRLNVSGRRRMRNSETVEPVTSAFTDAEFRRASEVTRRGREQIQHLTRILNLLSDENFSLVPELNRIIQLNKRKRQDIKLVLNIENSGSGEEKECSICLDCKNSNEFVKYSCKHEFCGECTQSCLKASGADHNCPLCRQHPEEMEILSQEIMNGLSQYLV